MHSAVHCIFCLLSLLLYTVPCDTSLNLKSVTPKDGGDQFDISPRKTLPAGAMFEEPNPPPLPTKSVLSHFVSLYVVPEKYGYKSIYLSINFGRQL